MTTHTTIDTITTHTEKIMIKVKNMNNEDIMINEDYIIRADSNGSDLSDLTLDIKDKNGKLEVVTVQVSLQHLWNLI